MAVDQQENEEPRDHNAASTSSTHTTSTWALRRAALEWSRLVQEAAFDYQHRMAAAFAEYQQTLKQIAYDASGEELATLEAAAAESQAPGVSVEHSAATARAWSTRVMEIRREANRRTRAAASKLAEGQQRSWFDAVGQQQEAYARYLQAVESAYASAAAALPSAFAVAGDEGPTLTWPALSIGPNWAGLSGGWDFVWR